MDYGKLESELGDAESVMRAIDADGFDACTHDVVVGLVNQAIDSIVAARKFVLYMSEKKDVGR